MLREHLGGLFVHALAHEDAGAVLDDEGPTHDLGAHIEELCHHAVPVLSDGKHVADGLSDADHLARVAQTRHAREAEEQQDDQDCRADEEIGRDEDGQVVGLHGLERGVGERRARGGVHRIEACLDEVHGHIHAQERADGVERLRQIEPAGGRFLGSHLQDVRVCARFEERQAARKDEVSQQERVVAAACLGRMEQQRAGCIERQAQHDARLVGVSADEDGCRQRHGEVAAVESQLDEGAVGDAHAENLGESFHHGVGDVVGKAPQGETSSDEDEGNQVADSAFREQRMFVFFHCDSVMTIPSGLQQRMRMPVKCVESI